MVNPISNREQKANKTRGTPSLLTELLGLDGANSFFVADAVSCCKEENSATRYHGVSFIKFMVELWDENSREAQPIFQVGTCTIKLEFATMFRCN
jgi:hypothetical protein